MITKEAKEINHYRVNRYYFDSARDAFGFLLDKCVRGSSKCVLLPSYIGQSVREGSGVFDPIRHLNLNYCFYRVNLDLSTDIDDFERCVSSGDIRLAVVIHYFGFPEKNIERMSSICRAKGIILLEDCAHSFCSSHNGVRLGNFADFSIYSIHKLLPTENGGILQINNNRFLDIVSSFVDKISKKDKEIYALSDILQTSLVRRRNYQLYLDLLCNDSPAFDIFHPFLDEGSVPLNFPVLINGRSRESLYYYLIDRGIVTVSLYYQMICEISKEKYPVSYDISSRILNLPVHQDTTTEDIQSIVEVFNSL